ncbi:PDZ domain-containing protein [candidate division KSB1 bacterium]
MIDKNQEKLKSQKGNARLWAIYLTVLAIIGGAVLAGFLLDNILERIPGESLEDGTGKVEAPKSFLGTELIELDEIIREQLDISTSQGALINSVIDGSPADEAGMQRGDVITRVDQERVRDVVHLQELFADISPGDRIKIVVERDNSSEVFYVKLGEAPAETSPLALTQAEPQEQTPAQPGWGMGIAPISPDMGQKYGLAQDQNGILVTGVIPGAAASASGIQVGDIITAANQQPTEDLPQFYAAIAGSQGVVLDIFRAGQTSFITVPADPSQPPTASMGMTAVLTGNSSEDDDEGYKGMPPVIPPKGEYDPETMGPRTTASTQNRVEVCICPLCGTTVTHPPGIPCSEMECPVCGSRLINVSPGITTAFDDTRTPNQGDPQRPSYAGAAKGQRDLDPVSLSAIQTGGSSSEEDDEDKGNKPSTIPPVINPGEAANVINIYQIAGQPTSNQPPDIPSMGNPTVGGQPTSNQPPDIPSMGNPTVGAQTTAGTVNRVEYCVCPACGTTVGHPAGVPCAELNCPYCGSRMIPLNTGVDSPTSQQQGGSSQQQGNRPPSAGQSMAQGSVGSGTYGSSGSGGPGGECVCPNCGTVVLHTASVPCYEIKCPKCGTPMVRAIPGVTISGKPETIPPADKGQQAITTAGDISQKLALSSMGKDLSSTIAPIFDESPYFIIIGLGSFQAFKNPNVGDSNNVGVQSAQFVVDKGAGAVITNNISLEAMNELRKLNVKVYSGISGTVSQALEWYMDGRLQETTVGVDNSSSGSHDEGEGGAKSKEKKGKDAERTVIIL